MLRKLLFFLFFLIVISGFGQTNGVKPNIFIDCQMRCENQFIRQEIAYVNYMQNRDLADIFIQATSLRTGAGGREVQLIFQGKNQFAGMIDTVNYQVDPNATDAIYRNQLVENLKKGLLPFIIQTPLLDNLDYNVDISENGNTEERLEDPWNFWVFNIGGNIALDGESNFSSFNASGRFSTFRITNESKFFYSARYSYEEGKFTLTSGEEFVSLIRRFNNNVTYVKSINEHWSAGVRANAGSSTFGNTDFDGSIKPAVEYNIYPYEEALTRRFTFLYSIGPEYKDYTELTIFDKLQETVWRQSLFIEFEQTQEWGSLEFDVRANQYLHNLDLYSISLDPNLEWFIYKGLSLDIGGFISLVSDRINIAKSDISDEDILLQIKQLDTNFQYFTYVGLNFRFGSKFNNFVNPRF